MRAPPHDHCGNGQDMGGVGDHDPDMPTDHQRVRSGLCGLTAIAARRRMPPLTIEHHASGAFKGPVGSNCIIPPKHRSIKAGCRVCPRQSDIRDRRGVYQDTLAKKGGATFSQIKKHVVKYTSREQAEQVMQDVFHSLYRRNPWGDPASVSGPGSGLNRTASFRDQIPVLLNELRAKSMLDAGCGDFNWMRMVDLKLEHYIGVDIFPELIAQNEEMFGDEVRSFLHSDVTRDELPSVDVVLCRDCLVHFSFADVRAALRNPRVMENRMGTSA